MNFNRIKDRAYNIACRQGFYDEKLTDEHFIMLVICEVAEVVEADRNGRYANLDKYAAAKEQIANEKISDEMFVKVFNEFIKDTFEDEIADVVIRLLSFAGYKGIDLCGVWEYRNAWNLDYCNSVTEFAYFVCRELTNRFVLIEKRIFPVLANIEKYCKVNNIDLLYHIKMKMRYNELRPRLNGKKY